MSAVLYDVYYRAGSVKNNLKYMIDGSGYVWDEYHYTDKEEAEMAADIVAENFGGIPIVERMFDKITEGDDARNESQY